MLPTPEALTLKMYWYKDPLKPPNNQEVPHPVGNQDVKHLTRYTKEIQ